MKGNFEMVKLLVDSGADLFALNEGDSAVTTARRAGQDQICDCLGSLMQGLQSQDPKIWVRLKPITKTGLLLALKSVRLNLAELVRFPRLCSLAL
jgi:hypothetical protein